MSWRLIWENRHVWPCILWGHAPAAVKPWYCGRCGEQIAEMPAPRLREEL